MASKVADDNIISVPFNLDLDLNKGLSEYFLEACQKHKNEIAQINSTTGKTETYSEFLDRSINLAQALQIKGITSKDVVAYCCHNNMDYAITIVATMFIGARLNPIDISAPTDEIFHCLKLSKPKIVFCDPEIEDVMQAASDEQKLNIDIVVYNGSTKHIVYNDFLEKYKSNEKFVIDTSKTGMDTACISYTSGTSGKPKAAQLKHFGLYYGGMLATNSNSERKIVMVFTLPYWISNIGNLITAIIQGNTRVLYKVFNKDTLCKVLAKYKVNVTLLTQFMINELIQNPECCKYDTSNLTCICYGGSTIGANQILRMKELFPNSIILNSYGMTEMTGLVLLPTMKEYDYSKKEKIIFSVGKPVPGFTYKVVDPTTEKTLGPNKNGELRLKYIGLWNGYLDNPKATEEAFDSDGFFKTGDIVYYDEDHFFYIIDRLKEIFKYKGYHISPATIEDVFLTHPAIKEAVAIGKPDDKLGELPMGVIVLKENAKVTEEELINYANEHLTDSYQIRGGVKFVSKLPKTSTGKIRRNYLRDQILKEELHFN